MGSGCGGKGIKWKLGGVESEASHTLASHPPTSEQGIALTSLALEANFPSPQHPREGAMEIPMADTRQSVTMSMTFPEDTEAACLQS